MKNLVTSLCFIFCLQDAYAQTVRDQSLTPTETAQQPNIIYQHDYLNPNGTSGGGIGATGTSGTNNSYQNPYINGTHSNPLTGQNHYNNNSAYPNGGYNADDAEADTQRREFMDIFCDPNVKPVATSASLSACIETSRQDACSSFQRLPNDVQRVLDHQIGCIHGAMNADGTVQAAPNCGDDDHSRLVLLKKYWRDQDTSYALVFLPDKVINGPAQCMSSRGGY